MPDGSTGPGPLRVPIYRAYRVGAVDGATFARRGRALPLGVVVAPEGSALVKQPTDRGSPNARLLLRVPGADDFTAYQARQHARARRYGLIWEWVETGK